MSDNVGESYNEKILQSIIDGTPYVNENPYPSRIEILLMELKEAIETGGVIVDQEYNKNSENPQSGTAVAQAIAGKQDVLTTEQQAAADSGITAAKVEQYDNGSAVLPEVVNNGAKNFLTQSNATSTTDPIEIDVQLLPGSYILSGNLTSTDSDAQTCLFRIVDSNDTTINTKFLGRGNVVQEFNLSAAGAKMRIWPSSSGSGSTGDTVTISDFMICTKAAWGISHIYEPYAPTNRELYEMILAMQ